MHKLNFCRDLCLPVEGIDGSRGLKIVKEFPEAVVTPMAGIATPYHALYITRPVLFNLKDQTGRVLMTDELKTAEDVSSLLSNPNYLVVAPDHALDPSPLAHAAFKTREDSLKQIVDGLFRKDFERAVIWINSGIGADSIDGEDGILRDDRGIAYATIVNGKQENFYQRGLTTTYQNSAHQHIHVAPTQRENGFDRILVPALESLYDKSHKTDLETYRQISAENPGCLPCISVIVLDSSETIPSTLEFTHYARPYTLAGLARTLVTSHSNLVKGIDLNNKEVKKGELEKVAELYSKI